MNEETTSRNRRPRPWLALLLLAAFGNPARAASPAEAALTLRDAVRRAIARAPQLSLARAEASESESSVRLAEAPSAPEAWLTTTPGYSSGLPVAVAGRVPAVAGVEVHQSLYNPELRSEGFAARSRRAGAQAAQETAMAETAREIVELYARCWRDQARVAAGKRECGAREDLVTAAQASVREGRQLPIDLERAQLDSARARQGLEAAESDFDLDLWELRRGTGWPSGATLALADDPLRVLPPGPAGDDFTAVRERDPASRGLEEEIRELERAKQSIGSRWAPVVDAEAQYARLSRANGYDEFYRKFKADDWSVGVSVGVPLLNQGRSAREARLQDQLAAARARCEARRWELDRALREARAGVERALASRSLAHRAQALEAEALELSRLLATEGRGEPTAVEQRTLALAETEEASAKADFDLLETRLRLLALQGELVDWIGAGEAGRAEP